VVAGGWLWGEGEQSLGAFPSPEVPGAASPLLAPSGAEGSLRRGGARELSSARQRRTVPVGGLW